MVTDRKIVASNGKRSIQLTEMPLCVSEIKGFDQLRVQNVTTQGFDQDGATLLNSYVMSRDMEIRGQIKANTTEQMQAVRNELISTFLPKQDIEIRHHYGGEDRRITARVEQSPAFSFTNVSSIQEYRITLTATNPYWESQEEIRVDMAETEGGFHFPLIMPENEGVVFGIKQTSTIGRVYNMSPIKIGMKYTFVANGRVKNPQLFNINTRKYMKLLCTMEAGEAIAVQTGQEKTVTRECGGAQEDYIGKIDIAGGGMTFLELDPGMNLLRYMADEGEEMLEVHIESRNLYPGV